MKRLIRLFILIGICIQLNVGCSNNLSEPNSNQIDQDLSVESNDISAKGRSDLKIVQQAPSGVGVNVQIALYPHSLQRHIDGKWSLDMSGYAWFVSSTYGNNFDRIYKIGLRIMHFYDNDNVSDYEEDIWLPSTSANYSEQQGPIVFYHSVHNIPNNTIKVRYYAICDFGSSTTGPAPDYRYSQVSDVYMNLPQITSSLSGPSTLQINTGSSNILGLFQVTSEGITSPNYSWSVSGTGSAYILPYNYNDLNNPIVNCSFSQGNYTIQCVITDKWNGSIVKTMTVTVN